VLDGEGEARLIALPCSAPPEGHKRWSLVLLKERLIELRIVDSISAETVRQTLKKHAKSWLRKGWYVPPKVNAEFVRRMEDVFEVYQRPRNPLRPQVCLDEASKQLLGEVRKSLPPKPGAARREDSEYVRHGTANLFMLYAPLEGWRHVEVTARRTAVDFARVVKDLVDVCFPDAETIVLVMDNLNNHSAASLYQAFPPGEVLISVQELPVVSVYISRQSP